MIRRPVTSTNVASVGWEPDEDANETGLGVLEVEFRSGHVYRYTDVTEATYREFLGADSIGRFFRDRIMRRFTEERVS